MRYFFIIGMFLFSVTIYGQYDNTMLINNFLFNSSDSGKIFFTIENSNFFKNNEYFNNLFDDYTSLGYYINAGVAYYPSSNTRIHGGVHLLKYSGVDRFTKHIPFYTFQYCITKHIDLLLGTIQGTFHHELIEPLYRFENYFENNIENGLQLLIKTNNFKQDVWINWEQFIFKKSPFPEILSGGTSGKVFSNPEKIILSFPYQIVAAHRGGQIDISGEPIETILNAATGVEFEFKLNTNTIHSIGTTNYAVFYNNSSQTKKLHFQNGYAFYPNVFLKNNHFQLWVAYWYGKHFISGRGEYLYQSVSQKYTSYDEALKQLLTFKLLFQHTIAKNINLGVRFECYADPIRNYFDYAESIFVVFNRNFFIKKTY